MISATNIPYAWTPIATRPRFPKRDDAVKTHWTLIEDAVCTPDEGRFLDAMSNIWMMSSYDKATITLMVRRRRRNFSA
jgi:hypothetical protein